MPALPDLLFVASVQDMLAFIAAHGDAVYLIGFMFAFARAGFLPPLLAGYAAHHGALDPAWTFLAFAAGSWLGDEARFFIGRRWGRALLARIAMLQRPVAAVIRVLEAYPVGFILTYRFAQGVRTVAALALGMTGIAWARFTPLNLLAAVAWAGVFAGAGFALGHVSEQVLGKAAHGATLGLLVVMLLAGWLIARRLRPTP